MAFHALLFTCVAAAVAAEIVSIAAWGKIASALDGEPADLMRSAFYRLVFILSALYIAAILLMFFSGVERFRAYAIALICLSIAIWLLRDSLLRNRFLQITESTVCLVMLIDTARIIVRSYLP